MGFTLMGAAVFFLDALQAQIEKQAITDLLYFLTGLSLLLTVYEAVRTHYTGARRLATMSGILISTCVLGVYLLNPVPVSQKPNTNALADEIVKTNVLAWTKFRATEGPWGVSTLTQAKALGQAVFVDFTADWCVNCKVFEKQYIDTEDMAKVFEETQVRPAKADYTRKDPPLKKLLKALGRSGLPTYVIYFPDGTFDLLPNGPPLTLESRLRAAAEKLAP